MMSNMGGSLNHEAALCANGCGFFGNPDTHNLCSLCFRNKQTVLEQPQQQSLANNDDDTKAPDVVASHENSDNNADRLKKRNRCAACNKQVGLLGFECRCGGLFCGSHRCPEMHMYMFDHKKAGRVGLSKKLFAAAKCKADKLHHRI